MMVEQYLTEDMHYTPYSVISYLLPGYRNVETLKIKPFPNLKSTTAKPKTKKRKNTEKKNEESLKRNKLNSNIVISSDDE